MQQLIVLKFLTLIHKFDFQEQKIKEGVYMMGLKDEIFYLSWFIAYALQVGFNCTIILSCFVYFW